MIVPEEETPGEAGIVPLPPVIEAPSTAVLLAQSPLFRDPVTLLGTGVTSPLVWGAQQGGALLVFDASAFDLANRLETCP